MGYLVCVPYERGREGSRKGEKVRVEPTDRFLAAVEAVKPIPAGLPPNTELLARAAIDPPQRQRPLAGANARLGSPASTEDFEDGGLDLNELLVSNGPETFFYRARGDSMVDAGIFDGDILIVDRSIKPAAGDVVLAYWGDTGAVCKIYRPSGKHVELESMAQGYRPIVLGPDVEPVIYVVTGSIRQFRRGVRGKVPRVSS